MTPKKFILLPPAAACFILFFAGHPPEGTRSLDLGWNLGHIVVYALWTYLFVTCHPSITKRSYKVQWAWSMGLALLIGAIIEVLQKAYFGRTADLHDVVKNMIGCALALTFLAPKRDTLKRPLRIFLQSIIIIIVTGQGLPLGLALTDEWIAREQFPALGTFETPFELTRWRANHAYISIDHRIKSEGNASLRIDLTPKHYSGTNLKFFPRDWRKYSIISFMVYNPTPLNIKLTCDIRDFDHIHHGYRYNDRFSRSVVIRTGWNRINFPIEEIKHAPAKRSMNLAEIEGLSLFVANPSRGQSFYLDDLRLEK